MDTVFVALRVALSLGVVLALLWVLQKRLVTGARRSGKASAPVTVVARQGLGAKASVVVVDVEGERLVLGVTESSVTVLAASEAPAAPAPLALVPGPTAPAPAPLGAVASAPAVPQEARVTPIAPVAAPAPAVVPAPAPVSFDAVLATQPPVPVAALTAAAVEPAAPADQLRPRGAARRAATASARRPAAPRDPRERARGRAATPLEGSILAPATWRQAAAALRAGRAG